MSRFNPRPGMFVEGTPPDAKKKDQNAVAVGPARFDMEEVVLQAADRGAVAIPEPIVFPETEITFGKIPAGYWRTSEFLGARRDSGATANLWASSTGIVYPFTVGENSAIDAMGITVTDNFAAPSTAPPPGGDYYITRVGVYAEVDGFPGELLAVSNSFSYGDGTMTTGSLTVLPLSQTVILPAGRYWFMLRKSGGAILPNPAYLISRDILSTTGHIPFTETQLNTISTTTAFNYGSFSVNFPTVVSGDPVLPTTFDPSLYTLTPRNELVPEIWVRGA